MKKPISKAKRTIVNPVEDDEPVRVSLELVGELKDSFLAVKRVTQLTNNAEVARLALNPGLKSLLEKFDLENTAAA